ncbi:MULTISPECIES: AraC family transcriptional regulator [Marinobacter]|uniref:AraC family transcriptional regulator n=1 Tax=Marinobacter TaxID=2742 RepID=UPI00071DA9BB|nr:MULTISPECIES: AraC family transcriptional regulator [unclassified Marinobacter]KRW82500.1 AraC family transcriptional regulator [Marinobacter sp. P4B1]MBO6810359.1 AraC family transcriptional regulator [Marinobacter sp.]MBO6873486.1 AraC family transcriptional regulator [Marinobacter sp.]
MKQDNLFQYAKSQHLDQVTALQAEMRDFSYGKHAHEEYSFGVTLAGRQDFFASGSFHRSYPGNIIIFNPGEVHDGHSGVDDALLYRMLYIHPDQLEPMLRSAGVKQSSDFRIKDTLLDDPLLRQHILNIALLIETHAESELQQECELYQLAARVAERHESLALDNSGRKTDSLLLRARDFIHANIQTDLSLDEISQHASLSKYHFLRMFRQQFGMTPHQYVLNCRINRAREDLESGVSLDDVVFNYGFSDLSHFNRRFKPIYGTTPREYQQHFLSG